MGNSDMRQLPFQKTELRAILQKQQTGNLINLNRSSKSVFLSQLSNKIFDTHRIELLQPNAVSKQLGFLYKPAVLFYEGGVSQNEMKGRGRLSLLQQHITYEGMFEDNQFHGNGVMKYGKRELVLSGIWERGHPKNVRFDKSSKFYSILVHSCPSGQDGYQAYKGVISYWEGSRYEGEFTYDEEKQRFSVTGNGRLYYKNNDYVSGHFVDGNLRGEGEFVSVASGRYKGQFQNGKFNGKGEFVYRDGKTLRTTWKDNKPHGEGILQINNLSTPVIYEHGIRKLTMNTEM